MQKMSPGRKRSLLTGLFFISPWIIGFLLFTLGPILLSVYYSFTSYNVFNPARWIGSANYITLFEDPLFFKSLSNTAYYTFLSVPGVVILSLVFALLLNSKL